ncbi:MAG: isoprenylcysteine carboxylmethyltransferase family protein [Planctomycetes bacterium]|nr:isoprenylcysteine carboxylmethyltransferase family protein [Planctomycetota bacterium]
MPIRDAAATSPWSNVVKTALYSAIVPTLLTIGIPAAVLRLEHGAVAMPPDEWRWIALILIIPGAFLYAWCAWSFVRFGHGTPNPADPPCALVARGPYRFVRNPMYVSVLAVILGEAVLFPSAWLWRYAVGSMVFVQILVLAWEERSMRRRFGADYDRYCGSVPRWFPRPSSAKTSETGH